MHRVIDYHMKGIVINPISGISDIFLLFFSSLGRSGWDRAQLAAVLVLHCGHWRGRSDHLGNQSAASRRGCHRVQRRTEVCPSSNQQQEGS